MTVFFFLSGFLITALMRAEYESVAAAGIMCGSVGLAAPSRSGTTRFSIEPRRRAVMAPTLSVVVASLIYVAVEKPCARLRRRLTD